MTKNACQTLVRSEIEKKNMARGIMNEKQQLEKEGKTASRY